jgi:hypothetical protein
VRSEYLTDGDRVVVTKLSNAADGLLAQPVETQRLSEISD